MFDDRPLTSPELFNFLGFSVESCVTRFEAYFDVQAFVAQPSV
jgi:hypothetical protein